LGDGFVKKMCILLSKDTTERSVILNGVKTLGLLSSNGILQVN
jgi:hypothetical protein